MPTIAETVAAVVAAPSWDVRINALRQVPANHGTNDWQAIYAEIARQLYVPHLSPDFAYIHSTPAYSLPTFQVAYERLVSLTSAIGSTITAETTPWAAPERTFAIATSQIGQGACTRSSISRVNPNS